MEVLDYYSPQPAAQVKRIPTRHSRAAYAALVMNALLIMIHPAIWIYTQLRWDTTMRWMYPKFVEERVSRDFVGRFHLDNVAILLPEGALLFGVIGLLRANRKRTVAAVSLYISLTCWVSAFIFDLQI